MVDIGRDSLLRVAAVDASPEANVCSSTRSRYAKRCARPPHRYQRIGVPLIISIGTACRTAALAMCR